MKVLMVGVGPKRVGGMWTVAENYITNEWFNQRVELSYVATSTNGSLLIRTLCMLWGYVQILCKLFFTPIDIVHIHMAEKGSTFRKGKIAKWSKRFHKKVIIHLHAGPFMAWYNTLTPAKQKKVREIFAIADKVFVLGEHWKRELATIIDPDKMEVLYNGVKCLDENPYSLESKDIAYFGVLKKEKGIYDLIDAVEILDSELESDVKIRLCGNDLEGNIAEYIRNKNLQKRIVLEGWVNSEKKNQILRNTMISVLPSYFEGLSMTIIEAMSYGVPVVTTNISTMGEVLGDTQFLVQPGDVAELAAVLRCFAEQKNLRAQYSNMEYLRVQDYFSLEKNIDKTYRLYCEL